MLYLQKSQRLYHFCITQPTGDFTFDLHEKVTRPDGVVEEHCVLWHDADLSADRALGEPLDVLPVDEDLPALDVVEAEEEADHRALSGASRTDLREK